MKAPKNPLFHFQQFLSGHGKFLPLRGIPCRKVIQQAGRNHEIACCNVGNRMFSICSGSYQENGTMRHRAKVLGSSTAVTIIAAILLASSSQDCARASESIAYTYDAKGRLTQIQRSGTVNNGVTTAIAFDEADNRSSYAVTGVSSGGSAAHLSITGATATEGGTLIFTVTRSGATSSAVSVSYATASGTATSGSDFTATSGTLNFAAGQTSKTINVTTIDDSSVESTEGLTLTLTNPSTGATITTASATGTINDNDTGTGAILLPTAYTASSNYNNYAGLSGNGATMRDAVYNVSNSIHGTGLDADNWVQMDLGASKAVGSVIVVPISDSHPDGWGAGYLNNATLQRSTNGTNWTTVTSISGASDGTLTTINVNATARYLRVRSTSNYVGLGDFYAIGSGTPAGPTISISPASITEGSALSFPVSMSAAASSAVTVAFGSSNGTASAPSDYASTSGTLTFSAGQTSKTINVPTVDDSAAESVETMTITLSGPTAGATLGTSSAVGTINDNDNVAAAQIAIGNASATEGGVLNFIVTRSGITNSTVSANYQTQNGTATSGSDYVAGTGTVTFSSGQTSRTVAISTLDDSVVEPSEAMTVVLSGASGATISSTTGTGTINDNDTSPALLAISSAAVTEGGLLSFTVSRTGNISQTSTVNYASTSGTAISGSDFTGTSGTLTFSTGQASKTISVPTTNDTVSEPNESMTITLSGASAGTTISTATGTGIINDDDAPANQPPTTAVDGGSLQRCTAATFNVLANDSDPEGNFPLTLVSASHNGGLGTTNVSSNQVFFGANSLGGFATVQYIVQDSLGAQSTGTLNINISGDCQ